MKFCPSCGAKLEESKTFCQHCGTKVENNQLNKHHTEKQSLPVLSRKMKLLVVSILALIIISIGLYKTGDHYTDKYNLVAKFEEHLNKGDADKLSKLLSSSDSSLNISDKHINSLLRYFEEYPEEKEMLLNRLKEDVKEIGIVRPVNAESAASDGQLIKMEQQGKKYFLYDNYTFVLQSIPLLIVSNMNDITYYVDGKKVSPLSIESDIINLGSYLPGEYKVEGKLASEFLDLTKEAQVSHFNGDEYTELMFDVDTISIGSNLENGTITIDGKDTGISFANGKNAEVGPVLIDGSMKAGIEADTPFGKVKSENVAIDSNHLHIEANLTDDQKKLVQKSLAQHITNFSLAIAHRDPDFLTNHSAVSEAIRSSIHNLLDLDTNYKGYVTDVQVDWDTFVLEEFDGKLTVGVGIIEKWMDNYDQYGNISPFSESVYNSGYILTYDSNEGWIVDDLRPYTDPSENLKTLDIDYADLKKQFDKSKEIEPVVPESDSSEEVSTTTVISSFVETFVTTSVKAINLRDFSIVSNHIDSSSKSYRKEFSDYIDYLAEKGITEDLINIEVVSVDKIGENTYSVKTFDEYEIYYSDGSGKYKSFRTNFEVRVTSEGPKIVKLIKTDEVESRDL